MQIVLKNVNTGAFQSFIKKLVSIDKFIFLKIAEDKLVSSVFLPQRDAVKLVTVPFSEVFDSTQVKGDLSNPIKVSFFNGSKVIDALSFFKKEVDCKIVYDRIGDDYVASDVVVYNDNLKIKLFCSDPSLSFMEMDTDSIKRAFGTPSPLFDFELLTVHAEQMKQLFSLNKDDEFFRLCATDDGVVLKGNNYDANICKQVNKSSSDDKSVLIRKKYLPLLDKENYKATICDNKVVLQSLDTNTLLTIAVSITADEDED